MEDKVDQKIVVEKIRKEIEASKGTHIWNDYVNALKLISQVVFTRSSGFILELIQNAEDSGIGLDYPGVFEIKINKSRVMVTHNGNPFSNGDVRALCGIRSSKKPEKGTLGYLGIGFKSVFRTTDCPEVYSGGFQFKFDRNHKDWKDLSNTPWHVLPIWLDNPSEIIDDNKTTFIIPFRDGIDYSGIVQEVEKLRTDLYLFLRWLKKIEVIDEISGQSWTLENVGEDKEGIATLKHNSKQQKFKFFRRTLNKIPSWVKDDRLTQEYRANVIQREIAIAFALDDEDNLAPSEAGAMYGGVYSFLPLGEAKSGAKFPIQADFLVQPGRDAINYEAKWNHWLLEEIASLCKEAIDCFKNHEKWKYQFLPAFEFKKTKGLESYDKLFGPKLIETIEKFLDEDECIPTIEGGWAKFRQVLRLTISPDASKDIVAMGILKNDEIAPVMGGQPDLKLVDPEVKDCDLKPIRKVNRWNLLNNDAFLEEKCQDPDASAWFRNFYLWLAKHPVHEKSGKSSYIQGYHTVKFVLTSKGKSCTGGKVFLPDLPHSDPILKSLAKTLQKSRPVLHPDIMAGAKDDKERETLKGFLTSLTGMQILDSKTVCKEALLPKILTKASKPSPDDLLKYTIYCQQILGDEVGKGLEFWVLPKKGDIKAAKEVFFSKEFKPEQNWEAYQQYVPGLTFTNQNYVAGTINDTQLKAWREFFRSGGMKDAPNNGVEEFAMNYAMEKLKSNYRKVLRVEKMKFGYDVIAETRNGEKIHIEVKGQTHDQDVELKDNEAIAADTYKDSFYLCVVSSIPENPKMHMVKNPAAPGIGKKDKLTISINTWKAAKWP